MTRSWLSSLNSAMNFSYHFSHRLIAMETPAGLRNSGHVETDEHSVPQTEITQIQITIFLAFFLIFIWWLSNYLKIITWLHIFSRIRNQNHEILESCVVEREAKELIKEKQSILEIENLRTSENSENKKERSCQSQDAGDNEENKNPLSSPVGINPSAKRPPEPLAVPLQKFLSSMVVFGLIMVYFFLTDYVKIFPQGERAYSRDTFLFLVFIFFLVCSAFTIKPNPDKILNRNQTEEWKGWMQVMFVWYHYFMAKEWYNWIRVYIACYVWMTGFDRHINVDANKNAYKGFIQKTVFLGVILVFLLTCIIPEGKGNFSFFWIRNDYSMWRLLKMLFRLNFLVIFVTLITNNEYMLYYICAMHTYWFLSVYVFMRVFNSWNRNSTLMAVKFAAYAVCNAIIFDIPGMTYIVFRPFTFILGLHDGSSDVLHEWSFRAGLDHWACFFGMLCAYNYPHFEAFMLYIDSKSLSNKEKNTKIMLRFALIIGCGCAGALWYTVFMTKDKFAYNVTHPFSSLIPIAVYIVGRNVHPVLRSYHIHMFEWLGKITLETYLSQLHIYLLSNARTLLVYIVGYPLLNFSLATVIYLLLSHTLFTITNDCSNFLIANDPKKLFRNLVFFLLIFGTSALLAFGMFIV